MNNNILTFNKNENRYEVSYICIRWLNELLVSFVLLERKVKEEIVRNTQVNPEEAIHYTDLQELFDYRVSDTTQERKNQVLQSLCHSSSLQSLLDQEFRHTFEFFGYSEEAVRQQFDRISCYSRVSPSEEISCMADSRVTMKRKDVFDLFVEWVCQHPLNVPASDLSPHQQLACSFEVFLPFFFSLAVLQAAYEVFVMAKKNEMSWNMM